MNSLADALSSTARSLVDLSLALAAPKAPAAEVARRRAANKVARRSRRVNRSR